jgi:hypothetical protein
MNNAVINETMMKKREMNDTSSHNEKEGDE